jgi:outer membrane receptor protein involved in Fe transport
MSRVLDKPNHRAFTIGPNKFFAVLLISLFASSILQAQTTGKIAGRIIEKATEDGMPGVNVIIEGTSMGAATDLDGYYTIINIPPGKYNVVAASIGYKKITVQDVLCRVNYTAKVDIQLEDEIIEGESVTIVADRPLIEKDQTGSKDVVTSDEIKALPVTNFDQVVELQAGVIGNNFRGGRDTEVLYLVDGVAVLEPFSGTRSATVGIQSIENLEVISGTFNAEYGRAMSGIVNAITKEGGREFSSNIEVYAGNFITSDDKFRESNSFSLSGIQEIRASLNGPVPFLGEKFSFVSSGGYQKNDGYLFGYRYFLPTDISIPAPAGEDAFFMPTGDSSAVPMTDSEEINLLTKLHYNLSTTFNLSYSLLYNKRDGHERWAYDQNNWNIWRWAPLGIRQQHTESFNHIISLKQILGQSAFYNIRFAYQDHSFGNYVFEDPLDDGYLPGGFTQSSLTGNNLNIGGTELNHELRDSKTYTLKGDLTWQANRKHELKIGFEGTKYDLEEDRKTILFGNELTFNTELALGLVGDYRQREIFGTNVIQYYHTTDAGDASTYSRSPIQGSFYIQDKMEFESAVVNGGLRFDYFDSRFGIPSNFLDPNGRHTYPDLSRDEALNRTLVDAPVHMQLSPRFGLAYQVTENGLISFSYGHFFQIPPLQFLYGNPKFLVLPGTVSSEIMGNAALKPQRTVSYELSYRELISDGIASEISFYYRDISDLLGTEALETINGQRYTRYANRDYGNVKGVIIALDIRRGNFYADIDYTFQKASGSASDPGATLIAVQAGREPNLNLIRLDWDQQHTIGSSLNYSVPGAYTLSLIARYGSGRPFDYQPLAAPGRPILQFEENNGQQPGNFNLDINASYNIGSFSGINAALILQGYNILDNRNPYGVFQDSGSPSSTATLAPDRDRPSLERATFTTPEDIRLSPSFYTRPREVRLGMTLSF